MGHRYFLPESGNPRACGGNWRQFRSRLLQRAVLTQLEPLEQRTLLTGLSSPFGAAVFTPLPGTPTIIAGPGGLPGQPLLDLNGDGTGDMIVQYSGSSGVTPYRDVSALLTHADGSATEYRIARYPSPDVIDQVLVTDLNHDGHPDVVIMHTDSLGETVIDFFLGQTNGSFTQPNPSINLGTLTSTPTLTIFDATGDHIPDLYLQSGQLTLTVYPGNGDGTFGTPAKTTFSFVQPNAIFQTDVTGDGIPDLVVSAEFINLTTFVFEGGIAVYKGTATGAYNTTPVFSDYNDNLTLLAVQTLSSSTRPDIVAYSTAFESFDAPATVTVLKNNGNGSFTKDFTSGTLTNSFDSTNFLTPDLNKDGKPDLILLEGPGVTVGSPLTVHVELNNGNGFTDVQDLNVPGVSSNSPVFVADVDGDGFPDLIVGQSGSAMATVFFNSGTGGFITPGVQLLPNNGTNSFIASQFRVLDLNNDGKMDVAFTSFPTVGPNNAAVFLNQTGRTFAANVITPQADTLLLQADTNTHTPADPALDYNGDGQPDFLGYSQNGPSIGDTEGFTLLTLSATDGFTSLAPAITFGATVTVPENPTPADINNDGHTDLVFAATADGQDNSPGIYIVMSGSAVPVSTAGSSSLTATNLGTITSSQSFNEFMPATTGGGAGTQSFFKFTLTSPQHLRITISPDAGDISGDMILTGSSGSQTALVGLAPVGPQGTFFYEWNVPAGTYTLEVDHGQGADTHYRMDIAFPPPAQTITILQGFSTLTSNQASPINFGTVKTTTTDTQKFFTIRNDGQSTLTLSGMTLPTGFTAGEDALPATLAPGAQATFSVEMNTNASGSFSGNVAILSDDPNTPAFDLPVQGTVTGTPLLPGISVKQGTLTITSGQGTPVYFPSAAVSGTSPVVTFTVKNTGNGTLTLTQPGPPLNFFLGSDTLVGSLAPGASDTFTIQELTIVGGVFSGNISIASNASPNPFLIPVEATVSSNAPTAVITGDGISIANGASTSSLLNATNFGTITQGAATGLETFTITNAGATALTLSGTAATGGFTVVSTPATSVAAHGTTTFKIGLPTVISGNYSGTVSFTTNDPNNTHFSFVVSGVVSSAAPTIGDLITNGTVPQGATLTLTAEDVAAVAGATIKTVKFYVDTNSSGIFNPIQDTLLGTAKQIAHTQNYALSLNAGTLPVGAKGVFAVATDSKGRVVTAEAHYNITPYNAPTIGSATSTPATTPRGTKVTLTATNVTVIGDTIGQVAFYLGVPGDDGDFNANNDTLLGTGKFSSASSTYTLTTTVPLSKALGTYPIYAVATSKHNQTTVANANDLTITDVPPTIKSISIKPTKVAPDNDVTVSFNSVADTDGTVAHVNVYWSPSGVTNSTAAAVLLGQATLVKGKWTFTGKLPASNDPTNPFPTTGTAVFLAQAVDNDSVAGNIVSATATATSQLLITGMLNATPTPLVHTQGATLTITGVTGSPKAVQFLAQNGSENSVDALTGILLGSAKKTATGTWTLILKNTSLPAGDYTLFARAEDSNGNFSEGVLELITVT